ncbi:MAG TPA: NUDIX hydrolase, partial [Sphingomicrobium sp.]|nr:NUDIX hydrolase [Sphingomicrobium sp.]
MTPDKDAPVRTMWAGKYISVLQQGRWEYVSRTGSVNAVVILAEYEGKAILVEQYRVPVGARCLELPAGLVGDEDPNATVDETAVKELEEETGFTADRVEHLGQFHSSPGMVAESFTLVRAHGVRKVGE